MGNRLNYNKLIYDFCRIKTEFYIQSGHLVLYFVDVGDQESSKNRSSNANTTVLGYGLQIRNFKVYY